MSVAAMIRLVSLASRMAASACGLARPKDDSVLDRVDMAADCRSFVLSSSAGRTGDQGAGSRKYPWNRRPEPGGWRLRCGLGRFRPVADIDKRDHSAEKQTLARSSLRLPLPTLSRLTDLQVNRRKAVAEDASADGVNWRLAACGLSLAGQSAATESASAIVDRINRCVHLAEISALILL